MYNVRNTNRTQNSNKQHHQPSPINMHHKIITILQARNRKLVSPNDNEEGQK